MLKMDCIPAGMELFPATDQDQFEFIKRIINDCDYYLLIIGGRYGSLTAQGISYTEQEYEYALERNLKVIALLHKNPDQIPFDKSEQKPKLRARLKAFREKAAKGRVVEFWQNEDELPGIVALSLINTIKMFPAVGWVRADKVSSEELLIEINELRKQNELMKEQLAAIEPSIFTGSEEKDFSYIYNQFNRFEDVILTIQNIKVDPLKREKNTQVKRYSINLASLVASIDTSESHIYKWFFVSSMIASAISQDRTKQCSISSGFECLSDELLRYGLLVKSYVPAIAEPHNPAQLGESLPFSIPIIRGDEYRLVYSEKLERYKYWLDVNGKMPERIQIVKKE
ncbi:hypothetical protein JCM14076_07030 [Methylosoma difficile]